MFDCLDDTIVAISSPPGLGPRGIVRLSGPQALPLAEGVFETDHEPSLGRLPGHRRVDGRLRLDEAVRVPAQVYVFRAPASFTGQDVVEFHLIGSPPVLAMLVEVLTASGARHAGPGEFSARAFFTGKIDLTHAEGVAAIINARSDAQLRASQALLQGQLGRRSTALRDQLTDLLARIEAEIDFAEERMEFVSPNEVRQTVATVSDSLRRLLAESISVERLEFLPEVMLVGPPNAGKSTLFNRLTGMERAIASATAGTTRDVLAAPVSVPGGEVMLMDSAGLTTDLGADGVVSPIEQMAWSLTCRRLASADMLLLIVPLADLASDEPRRLRELLPARPTRVVANKIDLCPPCRRRELLTAADTTTSVIPVSALTGEGLDLLRQAISESLCAAAESHAWDALALSNRQRNALGDALAALNRAGQLWASSSEFADCAELLAIEIRDAIDALSSLTGEVTTEELLDRVFSRFCIGK